MVVSLIHAETRSRGDDIKARAGSLTDMFSRGGRGGQTSGTGAGSNFSARKARHTFPNTFDRFEISAPLLRALRDPRATIFLFSAPPRLRVIQRFKIRYGASSARQSSGSSAGVSPRCS